MGVGSCSHVCVSADKAGTEATVQSLETYQRRFPCCSEVVSNDDKLPTVIQHPPHKLGERSGSKSSEAATLSRTSSGVPQSRDMSRCDEKSLRSSSTTSTTASCGSPKSESTSASAQSGMASRRRPPPINTSNLTPRKTASKTEKKASHILIKHDGSENRWSWRTGLQVSTPYKQALAEMQKMHKDINAQNFWEFALDRSDCHSYKQGGDLGYYGLKSWKKLDDVVNTLAVGQISDICETESGLHVVLRTA